MIAALLLNPNVTQETLERILQERANAIKQMSEVAKEGLKGCRTPEEVRQYVGIMVPLLVQAGSIF